MVRDMVFGVRGGLGSVRGNQAREGVGL
jgi:hypothetical protein